MIDESSVFRPTIDPMESCKRCAPIRISIRAAFGASLLVMMAGAVVLHAGVARAVDTLWEPLRVGAGGYVTGIDYCVAGTTWVIRTDTYGAYVGNPTVSGNVWRQLVRSDTIPNPSVDLDAGVYEIRVAPSDCNRFYMMYRGYIYRSTDGGNSWTLTSFPRDPAADANSDSIKKFQQKLAIDPANPDVVLAAHIANGLYQTTDAGTTWALVGGVTKGSGSIGHGGIIFDPGSGTTGGRTNKIYAGSWGNGVWRSNDAGSSWSQMSGAPLNVAKAAIASDGDYYVRTSTGTIHRWDGSVWSTITPSSMQGSGTGNILVDPRNPSRLVVSNDGGILRQSFNKGVTWDGFHWGTVGQAGAAGFRLATDIPWLAWTNETWMSEGQMVFDPAAGDKIWLAEGIGVWSGTFTTSTDTVKNKPVWTSSSLGIEQLVARSVIVPPGGKPVVAAWDRPVFHLSSNDGYPSRHGTEATAIHPIVHGWSLDYTAQNSLHLVALANNWGPIDTSGYSTDGGQTWTLFSARPNAASWKMSGCIAATNLDNILVVQGDGWLWRSTDRGATWVAATLPGATNTATERDYLHGGSNYKKQVLAVDRVNIGTVYLHFYNHGIYRSTDHGATWTLVSNQSFDGGNAYWHTKLRTVPGQAGHIFLTVGQAGVKGATNPAATHLWRSMDGGVTWSTVAGIAEPYDVALGKAAPGKSYPAIYVVGWYNNEYGIWRSVDNAGTWTKASTFPLDSLDEIVVIAASQDVYGDIYVGFNGSGWAYGKLSGAPLPPTPPRQLRIDQ